MFLYSLFVVGGIINCVTAQNDPCFSDAKNRLNCANENRKTIPGIPSLTTVINFQHNKLKKIDSKAFDGLSKLVVLRLDNNKIDQIEVKAFYGLPNLNNLHLSQNKIKEFDEPMVDPQSPLAEGILLKDNKLKRFPLNLLKRHKVPINVEGNPIACDCFSVVPKELKRFAVGECGAGVRGRRRIQDVTYADADCDVCTRKDCSGQGSCYVGKGSKALCLCFSGYEGESCEIDTVSVTQTSELTFEIISDLRITSSTPATGSSLTIQGCTIKTDIPSGQFKTYFIKDDTVQIESPHQKADGRNGNQIQMDPLVITKTEAKNQGLYKCAVDYENSLQDMNSNPVYVQFKDVSETRLKIKKKNTNTRNDQAEANQILSKTKRDIQALRIDKQPIIEEVRSGLIDDQDFWKFKILIPNVTPTERLKYCISLGSLSSKFNQKKGDIVSNMDCCDGYNKVGYTIKITGSKKEDSEQPTLVGETVRIRCQQGDVYAADVTCSQDNLKSPSWSSKSAVNSCPTISIGNLILKGLKTMKICIGASPLSGCIKVNEKAKRLGRIVRNKSSLKTPEDIVNVADIIADISEKIGSEQDENIRKQAVNTAVFCVDELMNVNPSLIARAQIKGRTSTKIVKAMEKISIDVAKHLTATNSSFSTERSNVAMSVSLVNTKNDAIFVVSRTRSNSGQTQLEIDSQNTPSDDLESVITIPKDALDSLDRPLVRAFLYKSDVFFLTEVQLTNVSRGIIPTKDVVGRNILSASIGDRQFSRLSKPITVAFKNTSNSLGTGACKFWDFDKVNWSVRGCWGVNNSTQPGFIAWNCSHLTNFALIIDVNQDINNPLALQIVTFIGCGISIGALLITVFIYLAIQKIRRRLAPRILISLSTSLMLLLVVFISMIDRTHWRTGCKVVAGVTQYFMLTTFAWMFCEAINLYRNFVILFKRSTSDHVMFLRMSIFAWGLPLVIVLLTAFLSPDDLGNEKVCVVSGHGFYFGMLLPIGLILLCNWVVLFLSMRGMRTNKILMRGDKQTVTWVEIWRAFVCATILGLTWTFGALAVGDLRDLFQWLFCIFNSLQGFFIFLLFVVNNKEIRDVLKIKFHVGDSASSSTQSARNDYAMKSSQ